MGNGLLNLEEDAKDVPVCRSCGRRISRNTGSGLCPACEERELFAQVRLYIRTNDVNEIQVAEKFGIPRAKVKEWIRQGRVEYKDDPVKRLAEGYCEICGTPLALGTICNSCKRKMASQRHGFAVTRPDDTDASRMRFLADEDI